MTFKKPTENQYPIHDLLRNRWSPRAFSVQPVEEEKLLSLLEAARWAPSGSNLQPWAFLIATIDRPEEHARMVSILGERNQVWARHAPLLVLTLANTERMAGKKNLWAYYDLGQAVALMVIQAGAMGLSVRQMGGFDAAKARELYEVAPEYDPVTVIAIGRMGAAEGLPEDMRTAELSPRSRKHLSEFVYRGKWNQPFDV
jgi:nitroreductase